jgi:hypothetical protein
MSSYPGRPDHPDFWLISQALLDQDAQSAAGQDTEEILGRMIDPDSAMYAAVQRAKKLRNPDPKSAPVAGAWLDGFLAGMRVQQQKNTANQEEKQ